MSSTNSSFTSGTSVTATSTPAASSTSTPLFSSTFSDPTVPTTSGFPGGGGGGGGGGGNDGNNAGFGPSIASSASLYLYTFLATLVLLLSVSAAIILRSLILRRRHRRMVEEAIRNGTWVPPSPGGSPFGFGARSRVDLSRKPVMWEAYVGGAEKGHDHGNDSARTPQTEWDWDSIRPFSASYVNPPPAPIRLPDGSMSSVADGMQIPPPLTFTRRVIRFLRPRPDFETASTYPMTPNRSAALAEAGGGTSTGNMAAAASTKKLRVAVLIAMPRPPEEPESKSKSASILSAPPVASTSSAPSTPLRSNDEEQELPHIEFGVAELEVHEHDDGEHGVHHSSPGKEERRASGSGSLDV